MATNLVELARFPTSAEAAIVRAQLECDGIRAELGDEAAASWLWHLGTAIGGVRLLVRREDAEHALDIMGTPNAIDESLDIDFGDDTEDDHPHDDRSGLPEDLIRAWRASLIGLVLLPPLLNLYSTWLLLRNGFFIGRCRNWRVLASGAANAMVLAAAIAVVFLVASSSEPPPRDSAEDGMPVKSVTETLTFPLVPGP